MNNPVYVYFMRYGDFVKIGSSENPLKRRTGVQSTAKFIFKKHYPKKLDTVLLAAIRTGDSAFDDELGMQEKFKKYWRWNLVPDDAKPRYQYAGHCEWFDFSEEIESFIASLGSRNVVTDPTIVNSWRMRAAGAFVEKPA